MQQTPEAIFLHRRSTRKYIQEPVTEEELKSIMICGLSAPTGHGSYAGEVIVITDHAMLEQLTGMRTGSADMLKNAGAAIAVIGDSSSDTWIEDCCAIMENMHLASDCMGLGSCWIQGRNRQASDGRTAEAFARDLLGFPEEYHLEGILSIGHCEEHAPARRMEELKWDKVHLSHYGQEYKV